MIDCRHTQNVDPSSQFFIRKYLVGTLYKLQLCHKFWQPTMCVTKLESSRFKSQLRFNMTIKGGIWLNQHNAWVPAWLVTRNGFKGRLIHFNFSNFSHIKDFHFCHASNDIQSLVGMVCGSNKESNYLIVFNTFPLQPRNLYSQPDHFSKKPTTSPKSHHYLP